jgi:DNA (cytosine-5)-methyltransferase 1
VTFGSLFAGVGGFDVGFERVGMRCIWQVEMDEFKRKALEHWWPDATRYIDIRECSDLPSVDVICGGFPCTDISTAHTRTPREGLGGASSGLWSEFRRIVEEGKPEWVVVENSPRWRPWVPTVRADLADLGYISVPLRLCAGDFGAPHPRPRTFVVANSHSDSQPLVSLYAEVARLRPIPGHLWDRRPSPPGGFRVDDGLRNGAHRLKAMGAAVVPQCADYIGRWIVEHAKEPVCLTDSRG